MKQFTVWLTSACLVGITNCLGSAAASGDHDAAQIPAVTVTQITYHGWRNCFQLSNGPVKVVVVPEIGGRIMEFSREGANILFQNRAERGKVYPITKTWHNYGGFKNWNAPQSAWGWPPDPYLDYGRATVEILEPASIAPALRVTGAVSLETGLVFQREIRMDPATGDLSLRQTMTNISAKEEEWSTWDITQVPGDCIVAVPLGETSAYPDGYYNDTSIKRTGPLQWHRSGPLLFVRRTGKADKVYADVSAGWMACFRGKLAYIKHFPPRLPDATYPDKGANAEMWLNDNALPYIEMEVLAPILKLAPGESNELVEQWQVRTLPSPVRTDAEVAEAVRMLGLAR